jgi:hypothetical protein
MTPYFLYIMSQTLNFVLALMVRIMAIGKLVCASF